MNWFVLAGGILWLFGAGEYYVNGNWRMMIVAIAYAISQFALMGAK